MASNQKPKTDNAQTLATERAQEHQGQNPRDQTHSRGDQRDTDSQGHPQPQDQNQQLGREGVRQQVEGGQRGK
jgi:hypothetical protein